MRTTVITLLAYFALLLSLELLCRVFQTNPYVTYFKEQDAFLYPAGKSISFDTKGLYAHGKRIWLRTSKQHAIRASDLNTLPTNLVLGDSGVEAAFVDEGKRWPDLLSVPTANYGVSGASSLEVVKNLKYLMEEKHLLPRHVFYMVGLNDIHALLKEGSLLHQRPHTPVNPLAQEMHLNIFGISVTDSMLLGTVFFHYYNQFGRQVLSGYKSKKAAIEALPKIEDSEFILLRKEVQLALDKEWPVLMNQLRKNTSEHGADLVLIQQQHALRNQEGNRDLRVPFVYRSKQRLSLDQSAELGDLIKVAVRSFAKNTQVKVIETDSCFPKENGELFYDATHFSPMGNAKLSECINRFIQDQGLI